MPSAAQRIKKFITINDKKISFVNSIYVLIGLKIILKMKYTLLKVWK